MSGQRELCGKGLHLMSETAKAWTNGKRHKQVICGQCRRDWDREYRRRIKRGESTARVPKPPRPPREFSQTKEARYMREHRKRHWFAITAQRFGKLGKPIFESVHQEPLEIHWRVGKLLKNSKRYWANLDKRRAEGRARAKAYYQQNRTQILARKKSRRRYGANG